MFRVFGVAILLIVTVATAAAQEATPEAGVVRQIVGQASMQTTTTNVERRHGSAYWRHKGCNHRYPYGGWAHAYRTLCY
jgi:hypothetical protein